MDLFRRRVTCAVLVAIALPVPAGADFPRGSYQVMDYGPVIGESIDAEWPKGNQTMKGLAVKVGDGAGMIFDTDLLRWSAATLGWIDLSRTSHTRYRETGLARTEGDQIFGTAILPGWAKEGSFEDPREDLRGNLPRDWAHYQGYYRVGEQVVLRYTVGNEEVLELPRAFQVLETLVFSRTLRLDGEEATRNIYVCELPEGAGVKRIDSSTILLSGPNNSSLLVSVTGAPVGARLELRDGSRITCEVPAGRIEQAFHIFLAEVDSPEAPRVAAESRRHLEREDVDFSAIRSGGEARWPEEILAKVEISKEDAAYVVDRIGIPEENPWNSWIQPTGFDFFPGGRQAAMSTWNGDVWIVSGLGGEMDEVRWRRFASGLYYPLGLAIVDETIYVIERGQLTRLHDLNGNGEADYYENFNNDGFVYPMAHSLGLEVDSKGNLYFFKNGNRVPAGVPEHGALIRVSPDGSHREVFSTGIRGSHTLGVGPDDVILAADQQGNWVPTARVDRMYEGGYYGYQPHAPDGVDPYDFESPVCWIPHAIDSSSGSITYCGDERWGPLAGNWTIGSYAQGTLLLLMTEDIGGQTQGGVVRFPLEFRSGLMRGRVNPADGQLYLLGMKGWSTHALDDASFDRIRFTGQPNRMPVALNVSPRGVRLTFSEPLDEEAIGSDAFDVKRWQYRYTGRYGSPEYSVRDPEERGRDPVEVTSVTLSSDGREVFLEIPDIEPVMQMMISYRLRFMDGGEVENVVYHTIHRLSEEDDDVSWATKRSFEELPAERSEEVARFRPGEEPTWFARGRERFEANCATCHQPVEQAGIAPPLEESEWAAGLEDALIRIVLQGKQGQNAPMMSFNWLSDVEIAELLSFIRVQWHEKGVVSVDTVQRVRVETEGRREMWTEEELLRYRD